MSLAFSLTKHHIVRFRFNVSTKHSRIDVLVSAAKHPCKLSQFRHGQEIDLRHHLRVHLRVLGAWGGRGLTAGDGAVWEMHIVPCLGAGVVSFPTTACRETRGPVGLILDREGGTLKPKNLFNLNRSAHLGE